MTRAQKELANSGARTAFVDLTKIGVDGVLPEQWYKGILVEIADQLQLSMAVPEWWDRHADLSIAHRFSVFFEDCIITSTPDQIVIFVDEIDSTRSLSFTDDFFATIRYLYNSRPRKPELRRLSFVLAGVATPSQLIKDSKRTPFNIGHLVDLDDFTLKEASPLTTGLDVKKETSAPEVLGRVFYWTRGHPYLTLRVFREFARLPRSERTPSKADHVVRELFFDLGSEADSNIQFVRDMLTRKADNSDKVLSEYLSIRSGMNVADREADPVKDVLKLSGIVRRGVSS
jgi:hypothetical protein